MYVIVPEGVAWLKLRLRQELPHTHAMQYLKSFLYGVIALSCLVKDLRAAGFCDSRNLRRSPSCLPCVNGSSIRS
jgi:hypothetical protein